MLKEFFKQLLKIISFFAISLFSCYLLMYILFWTIGNDAKIFGALLNFIMLFLLFFKFPIKKTEKQLFDYILLILATLLFAFIGLTNGNVFSNYFSQQLLPDWTDIPSFVFFNLGSVFLLFYAAKRTKKGE